MKKLVRLISVLALASTVAFVSCKGDKGDTGPQGPQGTPGTNGTNGTNGADGKDGNANVMSMNKTVAMADWTETEVPGVSGATSTFGAVKVEDAMFSADKFIFVYLMNGTMKYALPLSLSKEIDQSVESIQYSHSDGQVNLYYKAQSMLFGGTYSYMPSSDLSFKIVAIEETPMASLRAAGVDMSDYNQVVNYLNKPVSVPTQL